MALAPATNGRLSFQKIKDIISLPDLIGIQKKSFGWFRDEGLGEAFKDVSPIEDFTGNLALEFAEHWFDPPKHDVEECREKDMTFSAPMFVKARFVNKQTGEIKEQTVFMGDFPVMTDKGTFIINGTERVVVSQLVRSPGIYFDRALDKTSDRELVSCRVIPARGAWLEFEMDRRDTMGVRIDRKRRQSASVLLRALYAFKFDKQTGEVEIDRDNLETEIDDAVILKDFPSEAMRETLARDAIRTPGEALMDIYRKLRPGEPPTAESAAGLLQGMYFNPKRYDLAKVGRYKVNAKLGINLADRFTTITKEDLYGTIRYLLALHEGDPDHDTDDIDHFGNRRVRSVGELIANQIRIGLARMERVIKERMSTQDAEAITPQSLVNIRPLTAAIKEFFGTSQLSQFMQETNPLDRLTHLRRLSALGPGGLSRERAGVEVRDVHPSHYGRMCPIETPEGPNIGLIGSLASFARVNDYGFIETPYRKVVDGRVTDKLDYLTADREDRFIIAQANALLDDEGHFIDDHVLCRAKHGEVVYIEPSKIDYMDVSPRQIVSVSASLIPFLEHDDAPRTLMGSNMQRQSVPLLKAEAPLIGTGVELRAAADGGDIVLSEKAGTVKEVSAEFVTVAHSGGDERTYYLTKFGRSNQGTCINQRPIVREGDKVTQGQVLADGPCTDLGELSLGRNLLVAFMSWEGHNYEDAIIVSDRLVRDDLLTSIHIEEHEVEARDTKLGPEEITRDIPNVSEELLKDLDDRGIIRVGAEVNPGDILVGKVTPKGESELTPEERLLRAIFGEKARDVRDTSLKVPHGESGTVIGVMVFTREAGDELAPGVNQLVRVYVAQKRKISDGDKLAGRHGNKGVISKILPQEDMPFMLDGRPIDIILNPLGVPSRMNIGQILETQLGWVAHTGWKFDRMPDWMQGIGWDDSQKENPGNQRIASPVFDGAREVDIKELLQNAHDPAVQKGSIGSHGVNLVDDGGMAYLIDGRSGEPFHQPVTVGMVYILKLLHLVDDKIHARSTGPYSMITQQPLGGKAQFGGQRFGEMEVWALEAYGAAFALQELLTVKSDDVLGRVKVYEAIVKGENIPEPGIPESFKVLIKEMQSLCLNVEVLSAEGKQIEVKETDEDYRVQEELGIDLSRPERASAGEEL